MNSLRHMLEQVEQFITECTARFPEEPVPALLAFADPTDLKPSVAILEEIREVPPGCPEHLDVTALRLSAAAGFIAVERPAYVAYVAEAWMSRQPSEGQRLIRPSQDPDRIDAVVVTAIDSEGSGETRTYERVSSAIEKPHLRLHTTWPLGDIGGRIADALRCGMAASKAEDPIAALGRLDLDLTPMR